MLKRLMVAMAMTGLVSACDTLNDWFGRSPPPGAATPAPVPAQVSFMMFFDWGSAKMSDQGKATAKQAGAAFKSTGGTKATVTGYTDTTGSNAYNNQLALRRANAVKDALVAEGIPAAAITTTSSGEAGLLVPTGAQVNEARNRRVEVVISK
jgi:outer membrane protein OmpA-like peptidoglycan-associated protein